MLIFRFIINIRCTSILETKSKARPVSLVTGHESHSLHTHTCLHIFF